MIVQERLVGLYTAFKNNLHLSASLLEQLSPPLLLCASETWETSHSRILIVGQETLGWAFHTGERYKWSYPAVANLADFLRIPNSVEAMIYAYQIFAFARHQPNNHNSPFWRAYRHLRRSFDITEEGIDTCVLWTNLWRTDMKGGEVMNTASGNDGETVWKESEGILSEEIRILKPTAVIFFTGPNYDRFLQREFKDATFEQFESFKLRQVAWIRHPALPAAAIRSYHPGYLQRWNWKVLDDIERQVAERLT